MKLFISPCLIGCHCRYDAEQRPQTPFVSHQLEEASELFAICPEYRFFKAAPRNKIMLHTVETLCFEDASPLSEAFYPVLDAAAAEVAVFSPDLLILKEKSPSCGLHRVYLHDSGWITGTGLFTRRLRARLDRPFYNEDGDAG